VAGDVSAVAEAVPESLEGFIAATHRVTRTRDLWNLVLAFVAHRGMACASYRHFTGLHADAAVPGVNFFSHNLPETWVDRFIAGRMLELDPIPELALTSSRPFLWSETRALADLSKHQNDYVEAMLASGVGDGIAMGVFGPKLRNGVVRVGFGQRRRTPPARAVREIQVAAQVSHLAYCALTPTQEVPVDKLSPREREVLGWIARGKSNGVIAQILRLSPHTVDTLVRRIFEKLGVNDRVSAALAACGTGLMHRQRGGGA
jgi:LuxR family transcriptional regulator/LuxR family quorum-sensing system transcriptional regulator CciR